MFTTMNKQAVILHVVLIAVFVSGLATASWAGTPQPIALTQVAGEYGPQLGVGVVFTQFDADGYTHANPIINNASEVLFVGTIGGTGVTADNDTGLWVRKLDGIELIVREGDPVPGNPEGVVFNRFGLSASPGSLAIPMLPNISDCGVVAFKASLRGPGVTNQNDDAFFLAYPDNSITMIIRERVTELPGHPSVLFGNASNAEMWFGQPIRLTGDGRFAIRTRVVTGGDNNSWDVTVTNLPGTLDTFYRGGDAMPAPYDGVFWSGHNPSLNDSGVIAQTRWNTETLSTPFGRALWSTRTGSLQAIVREGDPVSGGGVYGGMSNVDINNLGRMTFLDRGDDPPFSFAVFSEGSFGVPIPIAVDGGTAPGTEGGHYALESLLQPILGDSNVTAFRAGLYHEDHINNSNDLGIWSNRSGLTVELELQKGQLAPGSGGLAFLDFQTLYLNAQGLLAVIATLDDSTRGLWIQDTAGEYGLIVRSFTSFDVYGDGSDHRLVTDVIANAETFHYAFDASTGDGRRMPLNDDGDMAFRLKFVDGSEGLFSTACKWGDGDCDGDVDLDDYASMSLCLTGPFGGPVEEQCVMFDQDADLDVDLADFWVFGQQFTGG